MDALKLLVGNPLLAPLLVAMLLNVIFGIIISIVRKEFSFEKLPNFMLHGTLFLIFLFFMDYLYNASSSAYANNIVTDALYIIDGGAWLSVILYYANQILQKFKKLGMPKLGSVEQQIESYTNPISQVSTGQKRIATQDQTWIPIDDDQGN